MRALAFILLLAGSAHAQMFKCVDARGRTQYADQPCPGAREVDIRGQPPISGRLAPAKEDLKAAERDFQRRQIQQGRQEEAEARKLAQAKQRCDNLRAQLARANAVRRPRDADAHEALLKKLNEDVARCG